jgi:hypothetical protein
MARKIAIFLILSVYACSVFGEEPVNIPDQYLKAAIEVKLGISDPNATEMLILTSLTYSHIEDRWITDLTGLEYATNLTELNLRFNTIKNISPLAGLTNLTYLALSRNQISDITSLATMVNLTSLFLHGNLISDISSLAGLKNLQKLTLEENYLNTDAYKTYLPLIIENNPSIDISYYLNSPKDVSATDGVFINKVQVAWESFGNGLGETTYQVYRSLYSSGTKTLISDWQVSNCFEDTTAVPGVIYYYYVKVKIEYDDGTYQESYYSPYDTGYVAEQFNLTISSTSGGNVVEPGEGVFTYLQDTSVQVVAAIVDHRYFFGGWFGTAVEAGKVSNPDSAVTNVMMNANYTLQAIFVMDTNTIYVDDDANGVNDGSSWQNAYTYLQDALTEANLIEKPVEIRVAQGIYKPDQGFSILQGDRKNTFQLINSVTLQGGYAGNGEPDPNVRDIGLYETILSGDLAGDDINIMDPCNLFNEITRAENSYHVVTGSGTNESAVLNGFTITAGNANAATDSSYNHGGGMYNYEGCPTLIYCIFKGNSAKQKGGGIYNYKSNSFLQSCNIIKNSSIEGGGIYNLNSNLVLKQNTVNWNFAIYGGGVYNNLSDPILINCIISENMAEDKGGGMYNNSYSKPSLDNCIFCRNSANYSGGIYNFYRGKSILTNCILWYNIPDQTQSYSDISYSNIQGGWEGNGNIDDDPLFADPNNGDYHLKSEVGRWDPNTLSWVQDDVTSPCIDAGDPNSDWGQELWPHGKRINMGAYGGTSQASMSLSNVGDARDLNNDDLILWDDILLLVDKWNSNDVLLKQDLNLDGVVDVNDLAFYENWSTDSNNSVPVLDSIEDKYITINNLLSFTVSASDNDNDEIVYKALGLPEGAEFSEQTFDWTPEQAGTYPVTFIVSDYKSLDYITVKIIVEQE